MIKIVKAKHGSELYQQLIELRHEVLRAPYGLGYGADEVAAEKKDIHLAAVDNGKVVGSLLLHRCDDVTVQLKRVAIAESHQNQGVGGKLIAQAEKIALGKRYSLVVAHARASTLPFYERNGYTPVGEHFEEVAPIPHVRVEKALSPA